MVERKKVTVRTLFKKAAAGEPIAWLTCYDYPTAYFQEQAGVDMILVGDSLGMTMLGYDSTLPVTMNDMIGILRLYGAGRRRPSSLARAD
jgi:3-methyl-2-oxobutanoate hydroxymethyltransferase